MTRAAFFGTPAAAVASLAAIAQVAEIELVVTRPDRPRGRSGKPIPSPVRVAAGEWGMPVAQPGHRSDVDRIVAGLDIDVAVVVAFGMLISPVALASVKSGFVNVHFSLLPRWRGAAPVERAILAGDDRTGVSLMVLDEGLDTGPVIAVRDTPIAEYETGGALTARLASIGAELLAATLTDYVSGARVASPQLAAGATHASRLTPEEAQLAPDGDRDALLRMVRAFHPRPGAWLDAAGDRLKVLEAAPFDAASPVGHIVAFDHRPVLGTTSGGLELVRVQPAGKQPMAGSAWLQGRRDLPIVVGGE